MMAEREDRLRRDEAEALNQDYHGLDPETREAVRAVAGEARRTGAMVRQVFRDGEVSAWPHPGGGIAWDVHRATLDGPRGVQRLAADYEPVITGLDQLQTLAAHWQATDIPRLAQSPADAKEALAGLQAQLRAARRWASRHNEPASAAESARCRTVLAASAEALKAEIAQASQRPDWREVFDRAGWPDERRTLAAAISGLIEGLVDRMAAGAARAAPDDAKEQSRRRGRG